MGSMVESAKRAKASLWDSHIFLNKNYCSTVNFRIIFMINKNEKISCGLNLGIFSVIDRIYLEDVRRRSIN